MQEVRLWEVVDDDSLKEVKPKKIAFEERLENWLAKDISVLDSSLLVIGRQVPTDFGKVMDLLCLDRVGDTVVIELKRGQTPRDTVTQALEYASWVKDLSHERITEIANKYLSQTGSSPLAEAFEQSFETKLPKELNASHRSLVVAESIDAATVRIVRYLSEFNVPINVATVQHFSDSDGRSFLAQVYLIEPEEAEAKARATSKRSSHRTVNQLQELAKENGVSELYIQMRSGVRGILSANAYNETVGYTLRRKEGGVRTVLFISAMPQEEHGRLGFTVHATRLMDQFGIDSKKLRTWLPSDLDEHDVSSWVGSSKEERIHATGLSGAFQNGDEVDKFLHGLKTAFEASITA